MACGPLSQVFVESSFCPRFVWAHLRLPDRETPCKVVSFGRSAHMPKPFDSLLCKDTWWGGSLQKARP
eukprot:4265635-Amphidinium_carterae.1